MLISALTACVLAASPEPVRLAATRFTVIDLPAEMADFYTDHFAGKLSAQGVKVLTPRDVAAVLGLERQKHLLSCGDSACLAEIANALGVDGLVMGDVVRVGARFQVNVKIIGATDAERLAAHSASVTTEEGILDELSRAGEEMAFSTLVALGRPAPRPTFPARKGGGLRKWWWAPAALGAVSLAGSGYFLASADAARQRLESESLTLPAAQQVLDSGRSTRTMGYLGLALAVASAGTAGALYGLGGDSSVHLTPSVEVAPGGVHVGVSGGLPW